MRRAALIAATLALLTPATAAAQTPHVVAAANGATARSSADEGEILSCGAAGCTAAITAPARPPATWDGELPVNTGSVIDVAFARPVEQLGAQTVDRTFRRVGPATVERVDAQHWRVILSPAAVLPDQSALELHETWSGDDDRGHYTVNRTDFIGAVLPAALTSVKQPRRGGGAVAQIDARSPGLIDAQLRFDRKTLGHRSVNLSARRRLALSVPLSRGARALLARRRVLKATLVLAVRSPTGDPLAIGRSVTLRAKPRR